MAAIIQGASCCRLQDELWVVCCLLQASPKPGWHEQELLSMPVQEAGASKELTACPPALNWLSASPKHSGHAVTQGDLSPA